MQKLFSADGIRGVIDRHPLRPEDTERLGRTVAAWLRTVHSDPCFLVGVDTRESSHRLKRALIDGLTRGGVRVVDAGVLPTAAVSYLIARKGSFASGAIVSASHNPVDENGIKLFDSRGVKLDDEVESLIEDLYSGSASLPFEIHRAHTTQEPRFAAQYAEALAWEHRRRDWGTRPVVVDCANGGACQVVPLVLDMLNIPHVLLNAWPDGTNINRHAGSEHVRLNPSRFVAELVRYDAEVGFAVDGDADRVLLVDRQGRLYDGDMILAMLALRLQREDRLYADTVVTTQMSNSGLAYYLRKWGIQTLEVRNGDRYITTALLEDNLRLGGEQIGHIIIHTDRFRVTGDGFRTALLILESLSTYPDIAMRDLAPGMRKWPQVRCSAYVSRRRLLPVEQIPATGELLQRTREAVPDLTRLECRPASTEPVYRIMLEARVTHQLTLAWHARRLAEHIQRHLGCRGWPIEITDCVAGGRIAQTAH